MDGSAFKARLKAIGKTQEDLAELLGKDRTAISRLLDGKTGLRVDIAEKIEAFLTAHEIEARPRGVREQAHPFKESTRRLSPEELERLLTEVQELGALLRNAPRLTEMSDDEILGYDRVA